MSEHRELTAEELRELASTHDDHKSGIDSRFNEQQDALRKELERFGNEHQSTRDELLAGLGDLKSEYQKLLARLAIDHTDSHNALRDLQDGHHSSLQDSLQTMEAALRKELAGISAKGHIPSLLAERVEPDTFVKVKKTIKDLIVKLMKEANEEAEHKGWRGELNDYSDLDK